MLEGTLRAEECGSHTSGAFTNGFPRFNPGGLPLGLEESASSCMKWQEAGYLLDRPPRRKGL